MPSEQAEARPLTVAEKKAFEALWAAIGGRNKDAEIAMMAMRAAARADLAERPNGED